jgi:hypothetical protein
LSDVQAEPTVQLATTMRDALIASGLQESNYIGPQGLYGRADLAGLNSVPVHPGFRFVPRRRHFHVSKFDEDRGVLS